MVMSDGGFKSGHGSAAWVIFSINSGMLEVVQAGYKYISNAHSSFACEVTAIDEAITEASEFIDKRRKFSRRDV